MKREIVKELRKNKKFLYLWTSQILTQLTVNLINFVIILRIFGKMQSTVAVSLVWLFYALPTIIVGPFVGTLIDKRSHNDCRTVCRHLD